MRTDKIYILSSKTDKIYMLSSLDMMRTLIWRESLCFVNRDDRFIFHYDYSSTQRHFEVGRFLPSQKQSEFLFTDKVFSHYEKKEIRQIYYCPFEKEYWINPNEDYPLCEIRNALSGFIYSNGIGEIKNSDGGMHAYLSLLSQFHKIRDKSKVLIKIKPHLKKKFSGQPIETKRIVILSHPWVDSSKNTYGRVNTQNLYNQTYGPEDKSFTPIKKSIARRMRKVKRNRELTKREQQFFSLMSGVNSLKQLAKKISQ